MALAQSNHRKYSMVDDRIQRMFEGLVYPEIEGVLKRRERKKKVDV